MRKIPLIALLAGTALLYLAAPRWGVPSRERNDLYFSDEAALERRVEEVRGLPPESIPRGMVMHLAEHPEAAAEKLPRSRYNPIRSYHPDEYYVIKSLAAMRPHERDFDPHQYTVGGAYLYPVGALIFLLSRLGALDLVADPGHYFRHPGQIAGFYVAGRFFTALHGIGLVLLVYLLAGALWRSRAAAITAGLLTAAAPLVLFNARFMYVDVPAVFWLTAAIYACVRRPGDEPGRREYLVAGLCAGLAAGTKFTFIVAALVPAALFVLDRRRGIVKALSAAGAFLAALVLTNPYFFITFPRPLNDLLEHTPLVFKPGFYLGALRHGLGLPLLFFCAAGFAGFALDRGRPLRARVILTAWTVFYFLFISMFDKSFGRYILPIVPVLVAGASGFWTARAREARLGVAGPAVAALAAGATLAHGMACFLLFTGENVRDSAGRWIRENIPPGAEIGVAEVPWQFQVPPLDEERYRVTVTGYDHAALEAAAPRYLLMSSFQGGVDPVPAGLPAERAAFARALSESGAYEPAFIFRRPLSLAGLEWRQDNAPEDLLYLNPAVILFERRTGAGSFLPRDVPGPGAPELLPVFGSDREALDFGVNFYVPVEADAGVGEKIEALADALSRFRFAFLPLAVTVTAAEDGRKIALVRLEDGHGVSWERFFQGSAGGRTTAFTLVETFLQRDYPGTWVDGVRFLYREPLSGYDHVAGLAGTHWR